MSLASYRAAPPRVADCTERHFTVEANLEFSVSFVGDLSTKIRQLSLTFITGHRYRRGQVQAADFSSRRDSQ